MKTKKRQSGKKRGFTIIELLTVMSIIIILIGLLVPAITQVRRYAREVKQRAQFHSIEVAMDLFEAENGVYPDSGEDGSDGLPYCGAMKLAEAMVGQDLLGFHPESVFRQDLRDSADTKYLYLIPPSGHPSELDITEMNRKARKGPYLQSGNANAARIVNIYGSANLDVFTGVDTEKLFVLTDAYARTMPSSGDKVGMPILYYRAYKEGSANPSSSPTNPTNITDTNRIYRHEDNDELVGLGVPWAAGTLHPLDEAYLPPIPGDSFPGLPESFYWKINNDSITLPNGMPHRSDSYILLSAGEDGLYGTSDDIYNIQKEL